ncbi:TetR/AcrR family transcriptional regulator [Sphingobium ummariense]
MRRNDRRESIMEVAAKSFLEHGYAATTMSGIAATVGGSKGMLWNYFPSKEGLFEAVLDRVTAVYRGQMLEMLANTDGDLRVTLHNVGLKLLAKATSRDAIALNRLVLAEAARFPEVGRIFYDRAPRQTQNLLAQFLGAAMARSQLRADDPYVAARSFTTLALAGCHQKLLLCLIDCATSEQMEADASVAVETFLRAYAP